MPTPVHVRRQIREAVAAALTGLTTTGNRVHQSRLRPQAEGALPCLLVETNDEDVEPVGPSSGMQYRRLAVVVRGFAAASANVDDTLDAIALEVETAMQAAGTLGGLIKAAAELKEISVEFDELQKPVGVVSLRFAALYLTTAGSPGTAK